jgi:hypothetical protein
MLLLLLLRRLLVLARIFYRGQVASTNTNHIKHRSNKICNKHKFLVKISGMEITVTMETEIMEIMGMEITVTGMAE